jgi:hypothetical protein
MDRLWRLAMIQETSDVVLHSYLILRTFVKHTRVSKIHRPILEDLKTIADSKIIVSPKIHKQNAILAVVTPSFQAAHET